MPWSRAWQSCGRELGSSDWSGPGYFPTLCWKRVSPPELRGAGSPWEKEVVLPEAEQMLSRQNNRCPLHLRMEKAVCRAFCMGQVVTENYLLIHTESKHFPLIPQTEQVQSSTSNNGLFPEDKKQLLPVDWGGGWIFVFTKSFISKGSVFFIFPPVR